MELLLAGAFCVILGVLLGFLAGRRTRVAAGQVSEAEFRRVERERAALDGRTSSLTEEARRLQEKLTTVEARLLEAAGQRATLEAEKHEIESRLALQQDEIRRIQREFASHFEAIARNLLNSTGTRLQRDVLDDLKNVLDPFREKVIEFQKKVEDCYTAEARERFSLTREISNIQRMSQMIVSESNNLANALRGDMKAQGKWGELVLERLLEASGLREGEEYVTHAKDMSLVDDEGKAFRPDVIVNLPENKHIVIDSKASLAPYESYFHCSDERERALRLKAYMASIYRHLDSLSKKSYHYLEKIGSPELVLMFLPIEGAFSLAVQSDPELLPYAWSKSVVLVGPTTLLATLRTVATVWKHERQTENALEIAKQGGLLFDKFLGFLSDFQEVGREIREAHESYESAMSKLKSGKGSIMSRIENLKRLGVRTSKAIPRELIEEDSDGEKAA